jgi:hypothetical protein
MPPQDRFDFELLDDQDPFELDHGNRPHLFSHGTLSEDDLYDVWFNDPLFFPAAEKGDADWLMVAEVPGGEVLMVPLAKPRSGDVTKARPIGLYRAGQRLRQRYLEERW